MEINLSTPSALLAQTICSNFHRKHANSSTLGQPSINIIK